MNATIGTWEWYLPIDRLTWAVESSQNTFDLPVNSLSPRVSLREEFLILSFTPKLTVPIYVISSIATKFAVAFLRPYGKHPHPIVTVAVTEDLYIYSDNHTHRTKQPWNQVDAMQRQSIYCVRSLLSRN